MDSADEKRLRRRGLMLTKSLLKEGGEFSDDVDRIEDVKNVDFSKEIHPLSHFISDRERMVEEMFAIITGEKLKKMLPVCLKGYSLEELKADCLVHLLGMSKKRILAILEGKNEVSSSDTEGDDDELDAKSLHDEAHISSSTNPKALVDQDSLVNSTSKRKDLISDNAKLEKKCKLDKNPITIASIVLSDGSDESVKIKKEKSDKKKRPKKLVDPSKNKTKLRKKPNKGDIEEENQVVDKEDGMTLLEILELEMRARAIRALLLKTDDTAQESEPNNIGSVSDIGNSLGTAMDDTFSVVGITVDADDVEIQEIFPETVVIDEDDDDAKPFSGEPSHQHSKENSSISLMPTKEAVSEQIDQIENISSSDRTDQNKSDKFVEGGEIIFISDGECAAEEVSDAPSKEKSNTTTWSERWAESKKIKDVLANSKLCANIRKRMRFAKMMEQKLLREQQKEKADTSASIQNELIQKLNSVEESSVAQFNLLKSFDKLHHVSPKKNQLHPGESLTENQPNMVESSVENLRNTIENCKNAEESNASSTAPNHQSYGVSNSVETGKQDCLNRDEQMPNDSKHEKVWKNTVLNSVESLNYDTPSSYNQTNAEIQRETLRANVSNDAATTKGVISYVQEKTRIKGRENESNDNVIVVKPDVSTSIISERPCQE